MAKTIKIKYHNQNIDKIEKINIGDWIDLRAAETVAIKSGEFKLISLGISMKLPDGYEAHIVPRSSTFKNYGIIETNSMGIIDETYCGDNDQWFFPAYCLEPKDFINGEAATIIHKNDRICQFRIIEHQPKINFIKEECLGNKDRGGHGSTGTK